MTHRERRAGIITRRILLGGLVAAGLNIVSFSSRAAQMQRDLSHLTPEQRASFEATIARMLSAVPYERVTVPGDSAHAEWARLKAAGRGWPVVIGDDEELERIAQGYSLDDPAVFPQPLPVPEARAVSTILAAAENLRFPDDLALWPRAYREEDLRAPVGDWPPIPPIATDGLIVALDILTGRPHDRVHILLIPTSAGWEAPAYLRWGDWNACPPPEYHVAALRSWHDRFGAELVGMSGDTMNIRVARRPETRTEAMDLAREQYRYCPDIVDQGTESLSALAAMLMANDWWFFWWD